MSNKVALVTGVSRLKGIGKAICIELAKRSIDIFFTYWSPYDQQMPWKTSAGEPDEIQRQIASMGVRCEKMELDLAQEDSTSTLLHQVESMLGFPHILINNATYSTVTSIDSLTGSELDNHYRLNVKATIMLTLAFIKNFKLGNDGRIINLTSGQSLGPMPNEIAYAITKGAIETLTYTLAQEIASKKITINAVNPGPNDTGWMDENLKNELLQRFPMNRIGQPQDTANLIGFLVSEEGGWITGQTIHSEGGFIR